MNARNLKYGAYAGLAGGGVFGMMMAMMGVLPMIGKMVGAPSAGMGFLVHMVISAAIGASFAVILGRSVRRAATGIWRGLIYGAFWWMLGALTLMPVFLGMGPQWSADAAMKALPSLMGHLVYGAILGAGYAWLRRRAETNAREAPFSVRGAVRH